MSAAAVDDTQHPPEDELSTQPVTEDDDEIEDFIRFIQPLMEWLDTQSSDPGYAQLMAEMGSADSPGKLYEVLERTDMPPELKAVAAELAREAEPYHLWAEECREWSEEVKQVVEASNASLASATDSSSSG